MEHLARAHEAYPRRLSLRLVASSALALLCAAGCGGRYHQATKPGEPAFGVEAAALPYAMLDARTGREVAAAEAWQRLGSAKVVCVGEEHPNPHHHWAQLEVVRRLVAGKQPTVALAMEMFQRPFQGVLDDYAAARIDEPALLSRTGWSERWGYDFAMYRPILRHVIEAGGRLIALNPAKELVKRISRQGLESLTAEERAALPELNLADAAHRAWFDGVMSGMGGAAHSSGPAEPSSESGSAAEPSAGAAAPSPDATKPNNPHPTNPHASPHGTGPSAERIYTVQVLWDESMADGAARWIRTGPANRAIVLAGNGHCHDSAIINRLRRRGINDVVSIRPVLDTGDDDVAAALAKPMNDYLFVMTMPPRAPADKP